MRTEDKFINLIKAGASIIQIISYETQRIHGIVNEAAQKLEREWYSWNRIEGVKQWKSGRFGDPEDEYRQPDRVLEFFTGEDGDGAEEMILILENFHPDLTEHHPENIQRLRNIALQGHPNKTLILTQPHTCLPPELEKEVQIFELPLPTLKDLKVIFDHTCDQYGLDENHKEESEKILESALGLTTMEARIAFGKAIVEKKRITEREIPIIVGEKENVIKKSGYLEYYHPTESLNDVGGLENLKNWLTRRGKAFDPGAKEFGLDTPRGILLLGLPGTGKSLSAKAVASAWNFPLLRLDMGKIYGGIVGQSEQNIRGALNIAETIAPSILWIDEIEKGLSGAQSSGSTDGGTTSRVLGTFLTWMQEKSKPVFVLATANDISQLPPELLRKGRVDEIFFVDLPNSNARKEILQIHLSRKKRDPETFDIEKLAELSRGFTGAELEEAVKEALFHAFDRGEDVDTDFLEQSIKETYPLSKTMSEVIEKLRKWAKSRAVMASLGEPESLEKNNGDIPTLPQETPNPFISK